MNGLYNNTLLKEKIVYVKDPFWYENPKILINLDRVNEFFPNTTMNLEEQLNASVRLTMYIGITMFLYSKNIYFIYLPIIAMVFTYLIYKYSNQKREFFNKIEKINDSIYQSDDIRTPTQNNPFMNVLQGDYLENPNREAISKLNNYNNEELSKDIDEKFYYNMYRDVDDVFSNQNSQRQFYTAPVTTIPNEQGKFADWCYKTGDTCKNGNGSQCANNNYDWLKDSKYRNPYI